MRFFKGAADSRSHIVRLAPGERVPTRLTAACGASCDPGKETGLMQAPVPMCRRCSRGWSALQAAERRKG